jgi:hypothetical protein
MQPMTPPRPAESHAQGTDRDSASHTVGWLQLRRLVEFASVVGFGKRVKALEPGHGGGCDAGFKRSWTAPNGEAPREWQLSGQTCCRLRN